MRQSHLRLLRSWKGLRMLILLDRLTIGSKRAEGASFWATFALLFIPFGHCTVAYLKHTGAILRYVLFFRYISRLQPSYLHSLQSTYFLSAHLSPGQSGGAQTPPHTHPLEDSSSVGLLLASARSRPWSGLRNTYVWVGTSTVFHLRLCGDFLGYFERSFRS